MDSSKIGSFVCHSFRGPIIVVAVLVEGFGGPQCCDDNSYPLIFLRFFSLIFIKFCVFIFLHRAVDCRSSIIYCVLLYEYRTERY